MTAVRPSDGGNFRRVPRCCHPVVNGGPDLPPPDRRLAWPVMTGDQQDYPLASIDRLFEGTVDRAPCAVEILAVKVDDAVGLDGAAAQPPIPAAIERHALSD